jgi:hypothetical protein
MATNGKVGGLGTISKARLLPQALAVFRGYGGRYGSVRAATSTPPDEVLLSFHRFISFHVVSFHFMSFHFISGGSGVRET